MNEKELSQELGKHKAKIVVLEAELQELRGVLKMKRLEDLSPSWIARNWGSDLVFDRIFTMEEQQKYTKVELFEQYFGYGLFSDVSIKKNFLMECPDFLWDVNNFNIVYNRYLEIKGVTREDLIFARDWKKVLHFHPSRSNCIIKILMAKYKVPAFVVNSSRNTWKDDISAIRESLEIIATANNIDVNDLTYNMIYSSFAYQCLSHRTVEDLIAL